MKTACRLSNVVWDKAANQQKLKHLLIIIVKICASTIMLAVSFKCLSRHMWIMLKRSTCYWERLRKTASHVQISLKSDNRLYYGQKTMFNITSVDYLESKTIIWSREYYNLRCRNSFLGIPVPGKSPASEVKKLCIQREYFITSSGGFSIDLLRRSYNTLALPCECVIYLYFFLIFVYRSDQLMVFFTRDSSLDVKSRKDVPFRGYKT